MSIKAKTSVQDSDDIDKIPQGYPLDLTNVVSVLKNVDILEKPSERNPEHFGDSQSHSLVSVNSKYGHHYKKIFWEESYEDLASYSTLTGNPIIDVEKKEKI